MNKYIIAPENCRWMEVEANSHEMAYRGICFWFSDKKRIAVIDKFTRECRVYSREMLNVEISERCL